MVIRVREIVRELTGKAVAFGGHTGEAMSRNGDVPSWGGVGCGERTCWTKGCVHLGRAWDDDGDTGLGRDGSRAVGGR
jgi:hypothetical protein